MAPQGQQAQLVRTIKQVFVGEGAGLGHAHNSAVPWAMSHVEPAGWVRFRASPSHATHKSILRA
jgi:hypothetical protein